MVKCSSNSTQPWVKCSSNSTQLWVKCLLFSRYWFQSTQYFEFKTTFKEWVSSSNYGSKRLLKSVSKMTKSNSYLIYSKCRVISTPYLTARPWAGRGSCFTLGLFSFFVGDQTKTSALPIFEWRNVWRLFAKSRWNINTLTQGQCYGCCFLCCV